MYEVLMGNWLPDWLIIGLIWLLGLNGC